MVGVNLYSFCMVNLLTWLHSTKYLSQISNIISRSVTRFSASPPPLMIIKMDEITPNNDVVNLIVKVTCRVFKIQTFSLPRFYHRIVQYIYDVPKFYGRC